MKRTPVISAMLVLIVLVAVLGCGGDPTESESSSLSGTVLVADASDHSGVTIAVYEQPQSSALMLVQQEHPGIGAPMNHPRFDHRLCTPVATTETNADGSFSINTSGNGNYIIIAYKSGYGFLYFFNQTPQDSGSWPADVVLYPEIELGGGIADGYVFETDHHYIITSDLWLSGTQSYVFEPGAWLRVAPLASITLSAPASMQGSVDHLYHITSNVGLDEFRQGMAVSDIGRFYQLTITDQAQLLGSTIEGACISFATKGLNVTANGLSLIDSVIEYCLNGAVFSFADQATCSNLTVIDNAGSGANGLSFEGLTNGSIDHNIFLSNGVGARVQAKYLGAMEDNLFQDNMTGLEWNQSAGSVNNNEFTENSMYDLLFSMNQNATTEELRVFQNHFESPNGVCSRELNQFYAFSPVHINYNEFYSSDWFIWAHPDLYWGEETLDASNNYFNGADVEMDVKLKIHDYEDDMEYPNPPQVDVTGFYTHPITHREIGVRD